MKLKTIENPEFIPDNESFIIRCCGCGLAHNFKKVMGGWNISINKKRTWKNRSEERSNLIRRILKEEGYKDWAVKNVGTAGNLTVFKTKELWMNHKQVNNLFWVIHEIAHIKYPNHENEWANHYTRLLVKYIE